MQDHFVQSSQLTLAREGGHRKVDALGNWCRGLVFSIADGSMGRWLSKLMALFARILACLAACLQAASSVPVSNSHGCRQALLHSPCFYSGTPSIHFEF